MLFKIFFKSWPLAKQASFLKRKGIYLGTRLKDGHRIHIYMYHDLFAEVTFRNDDAANSPEHILLVSGLQNLNDYLENDFRTNF